MCTTDEMLDESKAAIADMFRRLVTSMVLDDTDMEPDLDRPITLTAELLRLFVSDLEEEAIQRLRQERRREQLRAA